MSEMRLLHIDVCPVWAEPSGRMTIGMDYRPNHPEVVGWACVSTIELGGEVYRFLLNLEALLDEEDDTAGRLD